MTFFALSIIFGILAWCAWALSVRDANILYAAIAFILTAIALFFLFGIFIV